MGTAVGQADFINGMIEVKTALTAEQLKFSVLREIEYELGRNKDMPNTLPERWILISFCLAMKL